MIIRRFERADASECCQLISACISSSTSLNPLTRFAILSANVPDDLYSELKEDVALVAELEGQVVALGSLHDDEIRYVYVSPDYQGNGIGQSLIAALEDEATARGITSLTIQTTPDTVAFYEGLGYHNAGEATSKSDTYNIALARMVKAISDPAGV